MLSPSSATVGSNVFVYVYRWSKLQAAGMTFFLLPVSEHQSTTKAMIMCRKHPSDLWVTGRLPVLPACFDDVIGRRSIPRSLSSCSGSTLDTSIWLSAPRPSCHVPSLGFVDVACGPLGIMSSAGTSCRVLHAAHYHCARIVTHGIIPPTGPVEYLAVMKCSSGTTPCIIFLLICLFFLVRRKITCLVSG